MSEEVQSLRARVLELRRALRALSGATGRASTNAAIQARQQAHAAYVNSFDSEERSKVVALAQSRDAGIQTYEEALEAYGTSLIDELQQRGAID